MCNNISRYSLESDFIWSIDLEQLLSSTYITVQERFHVLGDEVFAWARQQTIPGLEHGCFPSLGSVFQAAFAIYDLKNLSLYKGILTENQIQHISKGEKPTQEKLDSKADVVFEVALALAISRGPLDSGLFEKAAKEFGKTGALVLINYVAIYACTCILLNGVDTPVSNIGVFPGH
ncbi:hypothetical protein PRZ48_009149 [Zasmidium cellare]|uniref:Uncharacterized protein n=1 Tax=Zasmidium cellare TaxID=395010 RepID=A0ABR0EAX8_ZASCE|nr:hypothetical protein PRZ48_009149 [Zasmidium cellare]